MDSFDIVVLGAGSAGEWIWSQFPDKKVAVIESARIGGECPFVACIPSKSLLRSSQVRRLIKNSFALGATSVPLNIDDDEKAFLSATKRRDRVSENRNDSQNEETLLQTGAKLFRGKGTILSTDRVEIMLNSGQITQIGYKHLVINTGSSALKPPVPGLEDVPTWSSDEALSTSELPKSLAVLGGGAVGCELAQVYSTFGVKVTLIEMAPHLLPREEKSIGDALAERLRSDGIDVRVGVRLNGAKPSDSGGLLQLDGSPDVQVQKVLVATGRRPNVFGIGLENLGISPEPKGIEIDATCRVLGFSNIWAAGDVTGIAPFTHTANYQGRIIVANMKGQNLKADYSAIPRGVYTDPPVVAVGHTTESAKKEGTKVKTATMSISETGRAATDGSEVGMLLLIADEGKGVLVGAAAIGNGVDEMIGEAALAIRAKIPLEIWADIVHAFPTYAEAYEPPLRELANLVV